MYVLRPTTTQRLVSFSLLPFFSTFPDLNFASYVLYICPSYETHTWHTQLAWITYVPWKPVMLTVSAVYISSVYWNNIFNENSNNWLCFCIVLPKPQRAKSLKQKQRTEQLATSLLRVRLKGFFQTVKTIFKPYTTHSGDLYLGVTLFRQPFFSSIF